MILTVNIHKDLFSRWKVIGPLGPVLFSLHINDLSYASESLTFHLFADDTNIYCACKNLIDLEVLFKTRAAVFYRV